MKLINRILLLTVISLTIDATVMAQETMYIYKDGAVVGEHTLAEVDSVIFYKAEIPQETTVTDVEGNIYNLVVIGTQTWMAENLKTTKYNDGSDISNVTDNAAWVNITIGAYCWYDNNEASYKEPYGALYNSYAVETDKLCPSGWHIPTESEWTILLNNLGGMSDAGGKMKTIGLEYWESPNTDATDASGFSAYPSGSRDGSDGTFDWIGRLGDFYAIVSPQNYSVIRLFSWEKSCYPYGVESLNDGLAVRCVKD